MPTPSAAAAWSPAPRSEEHTSELQSQSNLVCRLLLEKKNRPVYVAEVDTPVGRVSASLSRDALVRPHGPSPQPSPRHTSSGVAYHVHQRVDETHRPHA